MHTDKEHDVWMPQVPRRTRLMWGMGGFTDAIIIYGVFSLVSTIYINALAVNAVLVGLACALPRLLDAVSDPIVGYLSDNTRSRWGRRRPWLLAGLLICVVSSLLLWSPPRSHQGIALPANPGHTSEAAVSNPAAADPAVTNSANQRVSGNEAGGNASGPARSWWNTAGAAISSEWKTFVYLTFMVTLLMAVGYTLFNIPHLAMGYEMTTDYDERTHLFKWRFIFYAAAGFLTPWLLPLCMAFEGDQSQVFRGAQGIMPVACILGAAILATGLPSFFCRERDAVIQEIPKVRLRDAIRLTAHNRPFLLLLSGNFIARFGMAVTGMFFYYVFVYHIGRGEQLAGAALLAVFFNVINIANFLAMAPVASLASRIGKKPTYILMLAMSAVAYASLIVTFTNSDESFIRHTVAVGGFSWTLFVQWPSIITAVLIGVFTNTMPMMANSMIADVCDYDELQSGGRREGFYGSVFTSVEKIAWSVSMALQGILLAASGFNAALTQQAPETMQFWMLALIITQPVGFLIGIVIVLFYPLSRDRMEDIRRALEARSRTAEPPLGLRGS